MKPLLNTLYVTTPDAFLSKDGANVVVSADGSEIFRIPIHNIQSILTFGYHGASPGVMKLCVDNSVALSFFSPSGRFIARIQGQVSGNIILQNAHYGYISDRDFCLRLSSMFIFGKIQNSRASLRRFIRDYPETLWFQPLRLPPTLLKPYPALPSMLLI